MNETRHIWGSLLIVLFAIAQATALPVSGQAPEVGECETGDAEAFLDVGNVRAKIMNTGQLFWNGGQNVYEVPRGSGLHSIFSTTFLIGGLVDGDLHMAASRYGPFEFWPGPIPEDGSASVDCDRFDRIYEVRRTDGAFPGPVHGLTGDISDWPVELGAPFVDVNGAPGYQPQEGDYPEIVGDQMLWWVMNDRGNMHEETDTDPLGIEVHGSAFAFDVSNQLGNQTFYRYQILNRSDRPIRNAYVGLFHDVDLGAAFDDYIGSDSSSGLAYFYNADDDDNGNYGQAPPAVGFTVIRRPASTIDHSSPDCSLDTRSGGFTNHHSYVGGGGRYGGPENGEHYYNYLRSRWKDGSRLELFGRGYTDDGSGEETDFMYPGDPVTGAFWSELNSDGQGTAIDPSDRRSISGVGPFCLGPGDETEVAFAIVWARGESNLHSVDLLRPFGPGLQGIADDLLKPRVLAAPPAEPEPPSALGATIYPNPAVETTTLRLGLPRAMDVRVDVFDMLGRRMAAVVDARLEAGSHMWRLDVTDWLSGAYLIRIQVDHITETRTLVVRR